MAKRRIDERQRDTVKRQVPGGVPRIFPRVRHGEDVRIVEMSPVGIAAMLSLGRWFRSHGIALQPTTHVIVIVLLAQQQAGEGLPLDASCVFGQAAGSQRVVKFVRFVDPGIEDRLEILPREGTRMRLSLIGEAQADARRGAGRQRQ